MLLGLILLGLLAQALAAPPQALAQEKTGTPEKTETEEKTSWDVLVHIFKSTPILFLIIFGIMSVMLVTLIVLLVMDLRMGVAVPPVFVDEFTDTVNKRQFKQAYDLCCADPSFLARVLRAGMARLQYGIEDARETAMAMVESIRSSKEQLIHYLGTIGTLGPLLGLVGTVWGMIGSFMELATAKGRAPESDKLAAKLSEALVITLIGIALSVPAIFFHTFFRNRLTRITMDTSTFSDDLLTQMYHNTRKATAAAPVAAAPVAAPVATPAPPSAVSAAPRPSS